MYKPGISIKTKVQEEDTKSISSRELSRESSSDDDVTIYLPQSQRVHNR